MVRSDARENRTRILETARIAFTEDGAVSMNQIAQRAGVGAGTLYRHFPTREDLVLAVYAEEIDRITGSVAALLASHPPLEALRRWTTDLVDAMVRKHGLGDALGPVAHQAMTDRNHGPVVAAIAALLDAGKADGTIRPDAEAEDVLQLSGALWRSKASPTDRSASMLELVLDGLRASRRPA
jgi:AcrR family transcriptional regulator